MSLIAAATAQLPTITGLLDKVIPDPEQKARAQLELLRLQQESVFKELDSQLQTNLAQAKIMLFELIFGMLGLGTLRSADRWKRMNAITQKSK